MKWFCDEAVCCEVVFCDEAVCCEVVFCDGVCSGVK